jgi:hypothetical protein
VLGNGPMHMSDSTPSKKSESGPGGRLRWVWAALFSTTACALWFARANWDGCWLYFRGFGGMSILLLPWLWLFLFIALRLTGRSWLVGLTIVAVFFWPHYDSHPVAAAEASAVGRLRQLHTALQDDLKSKRGFAKDLPEVPSTYPVQRFYESKFVPDISNSGSISHYLIEATPTRRECGCDRSFTIADDGNLHHTRLPRAANLTDPLLQ